jgi:hypothetical protein
MVWRVHHGWERREPRRLLRCLVTRVDDIIRACEEAHLRQQREAGDDLAAHARGVLVEARRLLPGYDRSVLHGADRGLPERIDEVMDLLWSVQDQAFDALAPWRRELAIRDE